MVTATLPNGQQVYGYVMGSDDYHWALVTLEEDVVLVHKSAPALRIENSTSTQEQSDRIKTMTSGFRQFVMETHFSISTPKPPKA